MCCTARPFLGRHNTHICPPQLRSPWQDHTDTPKSYLVKQWVLLGLLTGVWLRGYLGAEKTQRQLHYQGPPQHGDSSWKLETWSPLQCPQAAWPVGECPCALVLFAGDSGLALFLAALLVSVFFAGWHLCEGGAQWMWSVSGTFWDCFVFFAFLLKELLCRMEYIKLGGNLGNKMLRSLEPGLVLPVLGLTIFPFLLHISFLSQLTCEATRITFLNFSSVGSVVLSRLGLRDTEFN